MELPLLGHAYLHRLSIPRVVLAANFCFKAFIASLQSLLETDFLLLLRISYCGSAVFLKPDIGRRVLILPAVFEIGGSFMCITVFFSR